jgi:hypothetical protein
MSKLADASYPTQRPLFRNRNNSRFFSALIEYVLEYNYIFIGLVSNLVPTLPVATRSPIVIRAAYRPYRTLIINSFEPWLDRQGLLVR